MGTDACPARRPGTSAPAILRADLARARVSSPACTAFSRLCTGFLPACTGLSKMAVHADINIQSMSPVIWGFVARGGRDLAAVNSLRAKGAHGRQNMPNRPPANGVFAAFCLNYAQNIARVHGPCDGHPSQGPSLCVTPSRIVTTHGFFWMAFPASASCLHPHCAAA
jgi:hypothetical protein